MCCGLKHQNNRNSWVNVGLSTQNHVLACAVREGPSVTMWSESVFIYGAVCHLFSLWGCFKDAKSSPLLLPAEVTFHFRHAGWDGFMCWCLVVTDHLFAALTITFLICYEENENQLQGGQRWRGCEAPCADRVCMELCCQMATLILPPEAPRSSHLPLSPLC